MEVDLRTLEAYVIRFLQKSVNIILDARLCDFEFRPNPQFEKWFNFPVGEVPEKGVLEEWRSTPHRPVFVKCFLNWIQPSEKALESTVKDSVLLELWTLNFTPTDVESMHSSCSQLDDLDALYKRMIVLTRVLYCQLRLLPAGKLHHKSSSGQSCSFCLSYELSLDAAQKVEEWDRRKDIISLNVPNGKVSISVKYNLHESLINDICNDQDVSTQQQQDQEIDGELSQDWVLFTREDGGRDPLLDPASHNQISAHFRNSFRSMRSVVNSFISGSPLQRKPIPPPPPPEPMEASLDDEIMQFLNELHETKPLECTEAKNVDLTYEMRCILLSKYL